MTNRPAKTLLWMVFAASLAVTGCKKEDEHEPNEGELITTVALSLTKAGSATPVMITFEDLDGPGGNAPTITPATLALDANATYSAGITAVLNKTVAMTSEDYDVLAQIKKESADHEFFYQVTGANLVFTGYDTDSKNPPLKLGAKAVATTAVASTGSVKITLKHKPGKKAAGDTVNEGETDTEVVFPVAVR